MRRVVGTAVLSVLLAVAGCGGEPSSAPPPSTSPASSSSSSPSAPSSPPVLPEEAKKDTKAGAVAFVRHYVELLNYAQATGDVSPLRDASAKACRTCSSVVEVIADLYSRGGTVQGGDRSIRRQLAQQGASGWLVLLRIRSAPQTIAIPGQKVRHLPGGEKSEEFLVAGNDGGWKVMRWSRID